MPLGIGALPGRHYTMPYPSDKLRAKDGNRVHVSIVGNDLARRLARLVLSCGVCQTLVATGLATPTVAQTSPSNASTGL
jgi:hypothetical protein